MSSFPYVSQSSIFNTLDYRIIEDSGISLAQADARYFRLTGGYVSYVNSSEFYLNGVSLDFTLLTNIIEGTVQPSKLIAVDANRDITNFRNISLSGTLIADIDISSPIINSNQYLLSGNSILTSALTGIVTGTAQASKALVLDSSGNISSINSLSSATINSETILNSKITNTSTGTINYPLQIQHLLSSGSPTNNSFGVGLKFQMPNSINDPADYGAISCKVQQHASGLQQGELNFYTSFAGSLVNAMTLSSLTSATNNILVLNGATSLFSAYRLVCDNVLCNSNILINKATLPSLTIASTATNTLSQLLLVTDNQTWEIGARGSTNSSNPTNLYIYNGQLNMVMSPAGVTQFLNSSVSTTSTSNAFQLSGGLFVSKAILNNSHYNCNTINSGATSHSTSTQAICLNDQAIYFRGQNAGDTNHGIMYSKNANWNAGKGFGNPSMAVDGPVLFGNAGVMIANLNSTSTETVCATFVGTTTSLAGNVNIGQPSINIAKVNINSPTGIGIINDNTHYANIGADSSGSIVLTATSGVSYSQYYFSYQNSLGLANLPPRSRLDFGNIFNNCIITLYQADSSSGTYQIGCNNSAIQYTSNGSNGHQFYYNSTSTPQALGTNIFSIRGNGNCIATLNSIANAGVHAFGFSTSDLALYGPGAHMHYAASKASFFGYDYSGGGYKDLSLNNDNLFIKSSNGYVGIQQTSPVCPLHVSTTSAQTTASSFGFLSSSGSGVATGFTNRAFSIRSDGGIYITAGEIDVTSDERFKEDIINISDDLALRFINKIKPIQFSYKNAENNLHYGYSAQELVKNHFSVLVGSTRTDQPMDEQVLIDDKCESITIPSDTKLIVNLLATIPLLHRALQLSNERIKRNEEAITILEKHLEPPQSQSKVELKRAKKIKKPIVYKQYT